MENKKASQNSQTVRVHYRKIWLDTNYFGLHIKGRVKKELQPLLPNALKGIPTYSIEFGDPKRSKHLYNRVRLNDFHFMDGTSPEMLWDLYFYEMDQEENAKFFLVPRDVFGGNGTIHAEGVDCRGWQHVGGMEPSTFRLDLSIALKQWFGCDDHPHCHMEAFLTCLVDWTRQKVVAQKRRDTNNKTEYRQRQPRQPVPSNPEVHSKRVPVEKDEANVLKCSSKVSRQEDGKGAIDARIRQGGKSAQQQTQEVEKKNVLIPRTQRVGLHTRKHSGMSRQDHAVHLTRGSEMQENLEPNYSAREEKKMNGKDQTNTNKRPTQRGRASLSIDC